MIKTCPICSVEFEARYRKRVTCSLDCRRRRMSNMSKRYPVNLAVAGRMRACRRRVQDVARAQFGPLSQREIELFNFAAQVGYRRGYQRRRHASEVAA